MKKLFLIITLILTTLFTSCTKTVYVDKETNEVIELKGNKGTDFINLQRIDKDLDYPDVYVDTYTDVLYMYEYYRMSPIMKADGTCLTYTEWKERNK